MIDGMDKLTADQQAHIIKSNRAHLRAVWPEQRPKYEMVEVWVDETGTTCARLKNGNWYHYYPNGTWG